MDRNRINILWLSVCIMWLCVHILMWLSVHLATVYLSYFCPQPNPWFIVRCSLTPVLGCTTDTAGTKEPLDPIFLVHNFTLPQATRFSMPPSLRFSRQNTTMKQYFNLNIPLQFAKLYLSWHRPMIILHRPHSAMYRKNSMFQHRPAIIKTFEYMNVIFVVCICYTEKNPEIIKIINE